MAPTAIPHLTVRFQGVLKSSAPKPSVPKPPAQTHGTVTIRLNGVVQAIIPRRLRAENDSQINSEPSSEANDSNAEGLLEEL